MTATAPEHRQATAAPGERPVHVRWVMPEGFFELPARFEDPDDLADQLLALSAEVLPKGSEEMRVQWAVMVAGNYDTLIEEGVQYAGFVITEVEGERCSAEVHVVLRDLPGSAGGDPLKATSKALRSLGTGEVDRLKLACGKAVSCIGVRQTPVSGVLTGGGADTLMPTWFIQVHLPLPNETVVILEMSTPSAEGWDVFSSMFAGVVKSLRLFDDEGTPLVTPW
ncbi:hypothetical protein [Streptomyces sp. BBFR102]|uniref:hypothetical protein n=1 Tax=Streptomyces sp. BBFR102 TaxID=3448171 RepID=UPI003F52FC0D